MDEAEAVIRRELGPQERFLWAGRARSGLVLRAADGPPAAFGAGWCATVGLGLAAVATGGDRAPTHLALILVGLGVALGRPAADVWRRARTWYGVTADRVLIVSGGRRPAVRSLPLDGLADLTLAERPGGGGAILLGPVGPPWAAADRGRAGGPGPVRLELAAGARQVYEIILQARQAARPSGGGAAEPGAAGPPTGSGG